MRAEYRVEQYAAKLGERLAALRARAKVDTTNGTRGIDGQPDRVSADAVTTRA